MSLVTMAWKYLCARRLASTLTVCAVALGVGLVQATFLLTRGLRDGFVAGATDYPLIVGAKGSATQLVLSTIFHIDTAPPNIPSTVQAMLHKDARVEVAVPVLLGDAYQGFRYVATSTAYFLPAPWQRKTFSVSAGRWWQDAPVDQPTYEALLGAEVARQTGLQTGDRFYEGEEMAAYPLTVVGILRPTHSANDRTIFLSLASFWEMNEVSRRAPIKPLTAVLVRPRRLSDLLSLHREFNGHEETQAVLPSAVLLNIFNVLRLFEEVLHFLLALVVLVVLLSLFLSLYSATLERQRDLATLRALGARRTTLVGLMVLEAAFLSLLGALLGLCGGHGGAALGAAWLAQRGGLVLSLTPLTWLQPILLLGTILVGTGAGFLPAIRAYRTEIAANLAPLS